MMTLKARYDGRVFIPEEPVDLPPGCVLEISVHSPPASDAKSSLAKLAEIANMFPDDPDMPTDAAAQHDHYLYGTPKRP
jgi:hypothetical protein